MTNQFNNPTFGVEIECYLRFRQGQHSRGSYLAVVAEAHHQLQRTINKAGIAAQTTRHGRNDYSKWLVEHDSSLSQYVCRNGYEFVGAEIVTAVLHHKSGYGSKTDMRKVFRYLHNRHHLLTDIGNGRTGLHVHVGNSRTGLSVMTAKKLAAMVVALEPVISGIVPASRLLSPFCHPPSHVRRRYGLGTLRQQLSAIFACRTVSEIVRTTQGTTGHDGRYTQVNLLPMLDRNKRTIEFRLFAGTTDVEEILRNVDFAVALVRFAALSTNEQWYDLVESAVRDPTFTVTSLLRVVGERGLEDHFARLWRPPARRRSTSDAPRPSSSQGHRATSTSGASLPSSSQGYRPRSSSEGPGHRGSWLDIHFQRMGL